MKKVEIYENYVEDGESLLLYFEEYLNKSYHTPNNSICRAVEETIRLMDKYDFHYANIVNEKTGEVLASIYTSS